MNSFKKTVCLLALAATAAACVRDPRMSGAPAPESGERALVTLQVRVPARNSDTRAVSTAIENDIKNLILYLATDSDNDGTFHMDSLIFVDKTTGRVTMEIEASTTPVKFFAVANIDLFEYSTLYADAEDGKFYDKGHEVEQWKIERSVLVSDILSAAGMTGLPMAGEAVLPFIPARDRIGLHIPLLRFVARADLKLTLGVDSKPFVPDTVIVYRQWPDAYTCAAASAYDPANTGRVIAPSFIASNGPITSPVTIDPIDPATGLFASAYLTEALSPATTALQTSSATCIVVGGRYNGSTARTFYRVDFNSGLEGHPFGQVLRNWQYVFNITKVSAAGYPTADEAATNPANSITMEVEMWDENVQAVNFTGTGDYMYVNTNSVVVPYNQGDQVSFIARSTIDFTWQLGTGVTTAANSAGATLSNADYQVDIVSKTTSGNYSDYTFTVTALNDNTDKIPRESAVFITAQGATLSVKVTQQVVSVRDKKINVLSAGSDVGSLGETFSGVNSSVTTNGLATQMRYILLNEDNFGPAGEVVMDGFNFEIWENINFTYAVNASRLEYMLEHVDVLNMSYPVNPNAEISEVICDWLWKDPRRVLIVMHDTSTVNSTLIAEINSRVDTPYDTSWITSLTPITTILSALGTLSGGIKGIAPSAMTDENAEFLGEPFGPLPNLNTLFNVTDSTAGALYPVPSGLVPLVWYGGSVLTIARRTDYAALAVDPVHRIVYIGEANMFYNEMEGSTTAPSPTGGNLNRILSNLWAWIVDIVLPEE